NQPIAEEAQHLRGRDRADPHRPQRRVHVRRRGDFGMSPADGRRRRAGTLTRQFLILVAVAVLATQLIDLAVTLSLPPTRSGATFGLALARLEQAASAVERAPPTAAGERIRPFDDSLLTVHFV